MHTDPAFADALVRFGDCAHTAVEMVEGIRDREKQTQRLSSIIRAMARFFWFTVESGLMQEQGGVKVYGSALLSSHSEIEHCLHSGRVQQFPLRLEWVINQGFLPNFFQPLLFTVDSFSHLYELVDELERWMRQGRLDNVAPGEPEISEADLQSFLQPLSHAA
jgi:phenylalanine-4-hydroxylase